jgi:hypothetical protein
VSPQLVIFGTILNDALPDDRRQELVPLIPGLVGTAGDGFHKVRSLMALDWLIRVYTPTWLDLAGLKVHAQTLRDLPSIVDAGGVEAAWPVVNRAQSAAIVARQNAAKDSGDWLAAEAAAGAITWIASATTWAVIESIEWMGGNSADNALRGAVSAAANAVGWTGDATGWIAGEAFKGSSICTGVGVAWASLQPVLEDLQVSAAGLFADMVRVSTAAPIAGNLGAAVAGDDIGSGAGAVPVLIGTWETSGTGPI